MIETLDSAAADLVALLAAASLQLAVFIGLVALATSLLRGASPQLRYCLWALVLVKALTPPWIGATWSLGRLADAPLRERLPTSAGELLSVAVDVAPPASNTLANDIDRSSPARTLELVADAGAFDPTALAIVGVWLAGVAVFTTLVLWSYRRLRRSVATLPIADEGPARIALEQAALAVDVGDPDRFEVRLADQPTGPFLFGLRRPTIVLPTALAEQLSADELSGVLAHELMHWRRRDTWVGWLQTLVQALFWFHPLVWWAGARLRDERERSCDDAVLRQTASDRDSYGEAIVRSLTIGRGVPIGLGVRGPLAAAGLVGVFEHGAALQQRLEKVMSFDPNRGRFGMASALTIAAFGVLFVPMAGGALAQLIPQQEELARYSLDEPISGTVVAIDTETKIEGAASTRITTQWPTTVCVMEIEAPKIENAKLVYSAQVKSDLDGAASLELWSHAGGAKYFSRNPNVAAFGKSDWKRLTIPFFYQAGQQPERLTLNVVLSGPGTVWVDDIRLLKEPLHGAASAAATTKPPQEATQAVSTTVTKRSTPYPVVVETSPARGDTDVDPKTDEIRVTYDRPMTTGKNYSWTGDSKADEFPPIDESREVRWEGDRTCVLPVKLRGGRFYRIGVNAKGAQRFKSADGKPAAHTAVYFATAGAKRSVARKAQAPRVEEMSPANGAEGVGPSVAKITATFDSPMGGGMSWVRAAGRFPGSKNGRAEWSKDGRSCTLPVDLEPGATYRLSLNGSHYVNFQSKWGVPLEPVEWTFTTAGD
ncbi:MAG: M56 family metallopeptidase [Planctomycetota bacterium]